jgi:hypothetical protein
MEYPLIVPAEIDPKSTLEDLQAIKNAWLRFARDNEFPKTFWTIVKWLGQTERSKYSNRESRVFRTLGVELYGSEETQVFNPAQNDFEYLRTIHVWAATNSESQNLVACWQWRICGDVSSETPEKLLFVTGAWVDVLLAQAKDAYHREKDAQIMSVERQRQTMLTELLVGVSV